HRRFVRSRGLDGSGELNLALVDLADARRSHRVSDVSGLDRTKQTTALARRHREGDGVGLELRLEVLSLFECRVLTSGSSSLDLLDLLLATTSPRHGEALGNEIVTRVAALDVNDVTGRAEAGDLVREDEFRHGRSPNVPSPRT